MSIVGVTFCCLIGRSIVNDVRIKEAGCASGEQKTVGLWKSYCIESEAEKKAWDLKGVVGIVMREKAKSEKVELPDLRALVVEKNANYTDLESDVLRKAIEYCDDLAVYDNYVYWTLTEKTEQITVIVITLISLVMCISSSVIRAKKQ